MKSRSIPVFDGPQGDITFPDWKTQVIIAFKANKAVESLAPWPPVPPDLSPDEMYNIVAKRTIVEGRGQQILYDALSSNIRALIQFNYDSTPLKVFIMLTELYGANSRAQAMDLHNRFNNCAFLDTDKVASFVARLRRTSDDLQSIDVHISPESFLSKVLGTLNTVLHYHIPVTTFQMLPLDYQNIDNLLATFLVYDTANPRVPSVSVASDSTPVALHASSKQLHSTLSTKSSGSCYYCHRPGHYINQCPTRPSGSHTASLSRSSANTAHSGPNPRWCTHHQVPSHDTKDCRFLLNQQTTNQPASSTIPQNHTPAQQPARPRHSAFPAFVHRASTASTPKMSVILDTGSTAHMCPSREYFQDYTVLDPPLPIGWGNQSSDFAIGSGNVFFQHTLPDGTTTVSHFCNVLHVPALANQTLISVSQMEHQSKFILLHTSSIINIGDNDSYLVCIKLDGLFHIQLSLLSDPVLSKPPHLSQPHGNSVPCTPSTNTSVVSGFTASSSSTSPTSPTVLWHYRCGHLSLPIISVSLSTLAVPIHITHNLPSMCSTCPLAKQTRSPFPTRSSAANQPLQIIHSDLCGPFPLSFSHQKYFVTFIDEFTRFTTVYLLTAKSQVFSAFKTFHALVTNQFHSPILALHSDNGGEYTSNEFAQFCITHGIRRRFTTPASPQSNGLAERMNRSLLNLTRLFLLLLICQSPQLSGPRLWLQHAMSKT